MEIGRDVFLLQRPDLVTLDASVDGEADEDGEEQNAEQAENHDEQRHARLEWTKTRDYGRAQQCRTWSRHMSLLVGR